MSSIIDKKDLIVDNLRPVNTKDMFINMLDDIYDVVEICGYSYSASRAFEEVDPIAFGCEESNYIDTLLSEGIIIEVDGEYYYAEEVDDLLNERS